MNNQLDYLHNKGIKLFNKNNKVEFLICFFDGSARTIQATSQSEFIDLFNYWMYENLDENYFIELK